MNSSETQISSTFDPTTWQAKLKNLTRELPDPGLAKKIQDVAVEQVKHAFQAANGPPLDLLSADDILTTDWPGPVWAVPGLLPVGLSILAGRPKVGKSWLALQIALAVAAGGKALNADVGQGPVLYLALEDPPRRLRERMEKQGWPAGLPADFMPIGEFATQVDDLRNGGGERLALQIELKGYRFVVIDTLSRAIFGDQSDVDAMTRALDPIQEMAHRHNCAVVLVDHLRKGLGSDPDVISDILGSTAKAAMADTVLGLYKERGKAGAKLMVTGKEVEAQTLALTWDFLTGCWQCEGDADAFQATERQAELLKALKEIGPASQKDLTEATGRNKGSVYRDLQDLVNGGAVTKQGIRPVKYAV